MPPPHHMSRAVLPVRHLPDKWQQRSCQVSPEPGSALKHPILRPRLLSLPSSPSCSPSPPPSPPRAPLSQAARGQSLTKVQIRSLLLAYDPPSRPVLSEPQSTSDGDPSERPQRENRHTRVRFKCTVCDLRSEVSYLMTSTTNVNAVKNFNLRSEKERTAPMNP